MQNFSTWFCYHINQTICWTCFSIVNTFKDILFSQRIITEGKIRGISISTWWLKIAFENNNFLRRLIEAKCIFVMCFPSFNVWIYLTAATFVHWSIINRNLLLWPCFCLLKMKSGMIVDGRPNIIHSKFRYNWHISIREED